MSEVFITRKGGGGKASAPELVITEVGASWIEFEVTNTDQSQPAQIFLLANYDPNSTEDFDNLAIQNGTVITVAAGATATEVLSGLDSATTYTISAQAAVIKKLPSNIVTTDPTDLLQTGLPAPTIGTLVEVNDTTLDIPLTNNETTIPLTIRVAVTTSTAIPTNYPLSEIIGALSTTSIAVSGLTPLTVYYIHARAFDGDIQSANVTFGPYTKQETPLYAFTSWTFTNAGKTGRTGPSISQVRSAYSSQSWAQNNDYLAMTTNGIQNWTVPISGTYLIECAGAAGGNNAQAAGRGYRLSSQFTFTKGTVLKILVGQRGLSQPGGGCDVGSGGGTFVADNNNTPIIIAGGGGGASAGPSGKDALSGTSGGRGDNSGGLGGTNGNGGSASTGSGSSGGGGFFTNGANQTWSGSIQGFGRAFVNGGEGGLTQSAAYAEGGFGGGAGGHGNCYIGSGGAGGYSGGGGGGYGGDLAGGGGGSFVTTQFSASNRINIGFNGSTSDGYCTITKIT
jgi:hypothetical protein